MDVAIQLEFISVVLPIQTIEEKFPGGWKAFLDDNAKRIGKVMWCDSYLVRATGCMSGDEADGLITRFTSLGFTATQSVENRTCWADFCVVNVFGVNQYDCPWIIVGGAERVAWLRGREMGTIVGRLNSR